MGVTVLSSHNYIPSLFVQLHCYLTNGPSWPFYVIIII